MCSRQQSLQKVWPHSMVVAPAGATSDMHTMHVISLLPPPPRLLAAPAPAPRRYMDNADSLQDRLELVQTIVVGALPAAHACMHACMQRPGSSFGIWLLALRPQWRRP